MIRDLEIEEICTAECRVIYLSCRDDCVDQSCDVQCSSEYTLCLNNCPCSINCPDGCAGCDYYLCENSTERIWKNSLCNIFFFIIPSKSRRLQHRQQRMILLRMSKLSAILSDTLALLTFSTLKDSRRTDASKRRQEEQAVITTWITQR